VGQVQGRFYENLCSVPVCYNRYKETISVYDTMTFLSDRIRTFFYRCKQLKHIHNVAITMSKTVKDKVGLQLMC